VTSDSRTLRHEPALDGLRGVAVAAVVAYHMLFVLVPGLYRHFPGGFLGVDVFFVLSGFLITAILLRERIDHGETRFGAFFARRALRLLPALAVFLIVFAIYAAAIDLDPSEAGLSVLGVAFYFFNWIFVVRPETVIPVELGHLWSLAVEEQFYLVWPFAIAAVGAIGRRPKLAVLGISVAVLAVAGHRLQYFGSGRTWVQLYSRTDMRVDALLVGALVGVVWTYRIEPWRRVPRSIVVASLAFLLVCVVTVEASAPFLYRGGFTAIAVAVGLVLFFILDDPPELVRTALSVAPLRILGKVSYATYIWHLPVFFAVRRFASSWPIVGQVAVALAVTAAFVALSWFLVEEPALAFKRRRLSQ
jgi:peptidoglycan/LPS O-acetylase OafA/YrhL